MSRNPYFAHLPSWRNRQDLAYALDSLPHILASFRSSQLKSLYPSPPSSTCTSSSSSFSSSTSSRSILSSSSNHSRSNRQHRLLERYLCSSRSHNKHGNSSVLQFSTRAQAMGFLIDILRSLQTEPCECDLVQGCFCSSDGEVEDHSGMAPCYVCGDWYAEQVYCRDEETLEVYQVDGRRWHERKGTSLRHHVAESRVRRWLEQVVVAWTEPQLPPQRTNSLPATMADPTSATIAASAPTKRSMTTPSRSSSMPASFLIPQEILDPSCRSPGFRIKNKDAVSSSCAISTAASPSSSSTGSNSHVRQEAGTESSLSTGCSSRFSFTSERFRTAVQESREQPSDILITGSSLSTQIPVDSEDQSMGKDKVQGHVHSGRSSETCSTGSVAVAHLRKHASSVNNDEDTLESVNHNDTNVPEAEVELKLEPAEVNGAQAMLNCEPCPGRCSDLQIHGKELLVYPADSTQPAIVVPLPRGNSLITSSPEFTTPTILPRRCPELEATRGPSSKAWLLTHWPSSILSNWRTVFKSFAMVLPRSTRSCQQNGTQRLVV